VILSRRRGARFRNPQECRGRARRHFVIPVILALAATLAFLAAGSAHAAPQSRTQTQSQTQNSRTYLRDSWALQSSCKLAASGEPGEQISSPAFRTDGWHSATVPTTVVAALVPDGTYPDPDFGMNLRSLPGTTYPIGAIFTDLPMPADSPFRCSWWYRKEFHFPENYKGRRVWLHFNGINYRANIWLNGRRVAGKDAVAGMYRTYEFDATPFLHGDEANSQPNVLALEVFAQTETDLGINFQDWNPAPPDRDMGLFDDVYFESSGPVAIRNPEVITHFPGASLDRADLTVVTEVHNATNRAVAGVLEGRIEESVFRQRVSLRPGETRAVKFMPEKFPQLRVANPKLWWPYALGPQNLYTLSLMFSVADEISDRQSLRFGVREITSELTDKDYRLFRVNGKKILIRGGGWAQDMLLRENPGRLEAELSYVQDMNLNTIRLEGQLETDRFFDLADERGILIMPGWVCCSFWQKWEQWKPADLPIAVESLRSQILRMRSHPSLLVWLNGSDVPPPPKVEKAYLKVLSDLDWPNPSLSSASADPTKMTGPSGVKMTGPYDYEPPSYWLTDPGKYGGAYGFNTETGPGAAIPPISSLRKMLGADHLWPIDEFWNYHSASEEFKDVSHFTAALSGTYGAASGLEDYVTKAQAMAYDGERAMFEAYTRNRYTSTGVIQWMLNNAWPSLFWHLYDYYLQPAGGYFGTKKACEPVHIQYSYDDRSVVVSNTLGETIPGLTAEIELFNFELRPQFSKEIPLNLGPDSVERVATIPKLATDSSSPVDFLRLTLRGDGGKLLSSNFYWLSRTPAILDWTKTKTFNGDGTGTTIYTPASRFDDFTALDRLPRISLQASATITPGDTPSVRVHVENSSDYLAFQVRLGIRRRGEDSEILPVLWDDNFFELLPGETREIRARYLSPGALDGEAELHVAGWNIQPVVVALCSAAAAH
jgi:exo-1,4-beta-D-glucosaminidase